MEVEHWTLCGFYDKNVLLLTYQETLRETRIEDVFEYPDIDIFKEIEGTDNITPWTDVSLLHEIRVLYYRTKNYKLCSFNVDTRAITKIDVWKKSLFYSISHWN